MTRKACSVLFILLLLVPSRSGAQSNPLGTFIHRQFYPETVRVEDVSGISERVVNGKLHLTLHDFLELVLKNSTEVKLSRLDVYTAADQITAAKAPLDPSLIGGFSPLRSISPQYDQIYGAETLSSLAQTSTLTYNQQLPTGQTVSANFQAVRSSTNNAFYFLNPNIYSFLTISITQPLLRDRNRIEFTGPLQIARTELLITSDVSAAAIADTIAAAGTTYWQAILARDSIHVQQNAVDLALKAYERDKKALDLGALGRLDIYTSEARVAQVQRDLVQAQFSYQTDLDGLRRLIAADLSPEMRALELVLDDDPTLVSPSQTVLPFEEALKRALTLRPEYKATEKRLNVDALNARIARNLLLPRLDLSLQIGSSGVGGDAVPEPGIPNGPSVASSSGLGTALGQTLGFAYPTYGFGLQFNIPLRNSPAQANLADALVNRVRDQYSQRQAQQRITLELQQAIHSIELAKATIEVAIKARDLSRKNVEAEQQKFELGTIQAFELLDAQGQLVAAESSLLGAYVGYQQSYLSYQRAAWTLLDGLGIIVEVPKVR
jgi:outer membrane protein